MSPVVTKPGYYPGLPEDLTECKWGFVPHKSPQWRAWKQYEVGKGRRFAFRYQDPAGRGVGCDVPQEWPPGYEPTEMEAKVKAFKLNHVEDKP